MKKQYTTPVMKVIVTDPSEMICVSAGFGDGETGTMHVRRRNTIRHKEEIFEDDFEDDFEDNE